jgi:hypothetical protein
MGKQFTGRAFDEGITRDKSASAGTRLAVLLCWALSQNFPMKSILAVAFLFGTVAVVTPTSAQAPAPNGEPELVALTKEVQAQQNQLLDNQRKIEAKLAEIAETIRVARLFGGRSK